VSSGNTAATAQASELLIGAIGSESYDTTFTVGTGYTVMNSAIANDGNNTNASISIFPEYRIVSATGVMMQMEHYQSVVIGQQQS